MSKDIGQEFGLDPQDVAKEVTETKRKYRGVSSIHIVRDNELLRVAGK